MKLSNEHRVLLNAALNSAFEEKDDLSSMLRLRLGKKYDDFAGDGLSTKIVSIISKAESQNWIFDLIKASRAQNPTNIALEEISTIIIKNYNEETNVDNTEIIPQEIVNFPENIDCIIYYKKKDGSRIISLELPEKKAFTINFPEEDSKIETDKVFKGVEPYCVEDCHSFVGRKDESKFLTTEILENGKNSAIIGEPFIGKTSIINAGIIASILEKTAASLIVRIESYDNFLQTIDRIIKFFDSTPECRKFLILDQFEKVLYSLDDYQLTNTAEKFKTAFSKNIQLILSSRNDESRHKIASINNKCNDKFKFYGLSAAEKLKCFSQNDCNNILRSLNRNTDDDFESDNFQKLITDCFQLQENISEISPLIFQIVCSGLQKTLTLTPFRERNDDFYSKNNAFFLLEDYVRSTLNGNLADIGVDSSEILSLLNTQVNQNALSAEEIIKSFNEIKKNNILDNFKIEDTLNRLEKEKLIFKRKEKNLYKYSLTIPSYDRIAKNFKEDSVFTELLTANQILHSKCNLSELASSNDLELFRKFQNDLDLNSSKLFFLLRSSFEESKPLSFWYEKLITGERGKKFLEKISDSYNSDNFVKLFRDKNDNRTSEETESSGIEDFLKNKAATSNKLPVRQTAIVALTVLKGEAFQLNSLELCERAEAAGTLLDYLPDHGNKFKFNIIDRFISWIWRVIRRIQLNTFSSFDLAVVLIFSVGGSLLFALSRSQLWGDDILSSIAGIIITTIAGFVSLIITILLMFGAKFSRIRPYDEVDNPKDRIISDAVVIIFPALLFGALNFLCNISKIEVEDPTITILSVFLGIFAGTGIGLGLKIQGLFNQIPKIFRYIVGGIISVTFFSVVQWIYKDLNAEQIDKPTWLLLYSGSEIEAAFAGISIYLGVLYATIKGRLFNENSNNELR